MTGDHHLHSGNSELRVGCCVEEYLRLMVVVVVVVLVVVVVVVEVVVVEVEVVYVVDDVDNCCVVVKIFSGGPASK